MKSKPQDNPTSCGAIPPDARAQRAAPLAHILLAARFSAQGFRGALANEMAFRLDLALCVVLGPVAIIFGGSGAEKAVLISSLLIVLITELLNSGIEKAIDRVGYEHHPLSGLAKDLGSAAVFCSLANVAAVWLLVFFG